MKNIEQYKKRFEALLESSMGDVKPLISEQDEIRDLTKPKVINSLDRAKMKYIVKKGDTISSIASKLGITVDKLKKLNPQIKNFDIIKTGDKINLPE